MENHRFFFLASHRTCRLRRLVIIALGFMAVQSPLAQTTPDSTEIQEFAVKVYIDVPDDYQDYIKTEIPFVNYMRDRKEAQVHILLTTMETGSGGVEHSLFFSGQNGFSEINDTLKFFSKPTDTEETIRQGIVRMMKFGLVRYVSKTPFIDRLSIAFTEKTNPLAVKDQWKNWVFRFGLGGYFNGEESQSYTSLHGSFSVNRVTPEWKVGLAFNTYYNEDRYEFPDETLVSISRSHSFSGLLVRSLGEHWSVGGFGGVSSSSYSNIDISASLAPALEFNVFPYSQATRRQLRFLTEIGFRFNNYGEETLYDKMEENLWKHELTGIFIMKEKWGSITVSLTGSHYLHDFSKNNLELFNSLDWNLFKGMTVSFFASVSMIHDQLSLPKAGVTEEEILLHRKQLATQYNYYTGINLNFTFGSLYTNVVNPRFDRDMSFSFSY